MLYYSSLLGKLLNSEMLLFNLDIIAFLPPFSLQQSCRHTHSLLYSKRSWRPFFFGVVGERGYNVYQSLDKLISILDEISTVHCLDYAYWEADDGLSSTYIAQSPNANEHTYANELKLQRG